MTNDQIAELFTLAGKLSELHGENTFKVKGLLNAAYTIEKCALPLSTTPYATILAEASIGQATSKKIIEVLNTSSFEQLNELLAKTPAGVVELLLIKGLGPKKIQVLWYEHQIGSPQQLLEAIQSGLIKTIKGFGAKVIDSLTIATEYYLSNKGKYLYAQLEPLASKLMAQLQQIFGPSSVRITGEYLRQMPVLSQLEYVVHHVPQAIIQSLQPNNSWQLQQHNGNEISYLYGKLNVKIYACADEFREQQLFDTTGPAAFVQAFKQQYPDAQYLGSDNDTDDVVFTSVKLPYIPPCLRDMPNVLNIAQRNKIPKLITLADIKGIIHNHSTYSDGAASLQDMAHACINGGFEYFVISDHSQFASYAKGLDADRIAQQHLEIDSLNKQLQPFKIYKSIECDILPDGELDYNPDILHSFDVIVASVHSVLNMTQGKAMDRLIKAIENPFTSILGHCTGRLLLSRAGYPLDMPLIIDACAANDVVIELNANPYRLDIDYTWIPLAIEKGVLISINPDAHSTAGINDIHYGVLAAQKGGATKYHNLSSFSLSEFDDFVQQQLQKRL
jgi:DNA polymerase (family X)